MYEALIKFRNLKDFSVITIHLCFASDSLHNAKLEAIFRASNQLNPYLEYGLIEVDCKQVYTTLK
jgi:hypothetical protein